MHTGSVDLSVGNSFVQEGSANGGRGQRSLVSVRVGVARCSVFCHVFAGATGAKPWFFSFGLGKTL